MSEPIHDVAVSSTLWIFQNSKDTIVGLLQIDVEKLVTVPTRLCFTRLEV